MNARERLPAALLGLLTVLAPLACLARAGAVVAPRARRAEKRQSPHDSSLGILRHSKRDRQREVEPKFAFSLAIGKVDA
jgi:hypothetical protein